MHQLPCRPAVHPSRSRVNAIIQLCHCFRRSVPAGPCTSRVHYHVSHKKFVMRVLTHLVLNNLAHEVPQLLVVAWHPSVYRAATVSHTAAIAGARLRYLIPNAVVTAHLRGLLVVGPREVPLHERQVLEGVDRRGALAGRCGPRETALPNPVQPAKRDARLKLSSNLSSTLNIGCRLTQTVHAWCSIAASAPGRFNQIEKLVGSTEGRWLDWSPPKNGV